MGYDIATRVGRAHAAVEAYMDEHPDYRDESTLVHDEVLIDLIADLLHYCSKEGMDPDAILRMATSHFEAEKGGG